MADLVTDAVEHRLSQLGLEGTFSLWLERPHIPPRAIQAFLAKVVCGRDVARPAGQTSRCPAAESWQVAGEERVEGRTIPVPGSGQQMDRGFRVGRTHDWWKRPKG